MKMIIKKIKYSLLLDNHKIGNITIEYKYNIEVNIELFPGVKTIPKIVSEDYKMIFNLTEIEDTLINTITEHLIKILENSDSIHLNIYKKIFLIDQDIKDIGLINLTYDFSERENKKPIKRVTFWSLKNSFEYDIDKTDENILDEITKHLEDFIF
jgi:hypothetical protein